MTPEELDDLIAWAVEQSIFARRLTARLVDELGKDGLPDRLNAEMSKETHKIWVALDRIEKTAKLLRSRLP